MLPATTTRVAEHSAAFLNERIRRRTRARLESLADAEEAVLERRLAELEREWDVERALETNFALVCLASLTLGRLVHPRWRLLSGVASCFMVQHALQGWCPPLGLMRRLGFRTTREIEQERLGLRLLRGDFAGLPASSGERRARLEEVLDAIERPVGKRAMRP